MMLYGWGSTPHSTPTSSGWRGSLGLLRLVIMFFWNESYRRGMIKRDGLMFSEVVMESVAATKLGFRPRQPALGLCSD